MAIGAKFEMDNRKLVIAAAVIVGLILAVILWPSATPEPVEVEAEVAPTLELVAPEEPTLVSIEAVEQESDVLPDLPLPPRIVKAPADLNQSDQSARTAAADLSVQLGRLLVPAEQLRKWVVFVDRVADGELLSKHRPWQLNLGSFSADGEDDELQLSSSNYGRYSAAISIVETVPAEKLAYYLDQWTPLFEEAYAELGRPGVFKQRLLAALDQIIAAQALTVRPRLIQPSVMYKYADIRLESASDVQKLMWRMGPDNMTRLQRYAHELREFIAAPPEYRDEF